ncbi:hypothetical protein DY000_02052352 [Brassica cretica]|uniref:Uncharacterized protein n=1 Tax=Brassica cretica TaxID=69181 RepID=A0ABQ7AFW8_BRACR|nr:hypothetical protein DY000_02052352 [Brassica cretica]
MASRVISASVRNGARRVLAIVLDNKERRKALIPTWRSISTVTQLKSKDLVVNSQS